MSDRPEQSNSITVKLKAGDGEIIEVDKNVAMQIKFVGGLLEDVGETDGMEIPIGDVDSVILAKVVEFCKMQYEHELNNISANAIQSWEKNFVDVDKSSLFQLILAANFLDVESLLNLACKTVADMMKGKTTEQIREEFEIDNDFSMERLEELRRDNMWRSEGF